MKKLTILLFILLLPSVSAIVNHTTNVDIGVVVTPNVTKNISVDIDLGSEEISSGGGGGSSSTTTQTNDSSGGIECLEDWICTHWTNCSNSKQARICADWSNCNTTLLKPKIEQSCSLPIVAPPPQTIVEKVKVEVKEVVQIVKEKIIIHWQLSIVLALVFIAGCSLIFTKYNGHKKNIKTV